MTGHYNPSEELILKTVKLFGYMTRFLLQIYFFGFDKRSKSLEVYLPKLEREGKLIVSNHEGKKVYSPARKNRVQKNSIAHELGWVEIFIRLWRCRINEWELVPEKEFRGFSVVPEVGIRYSAERGTMIVIEHSTSDNFKRQGGGVVKSKITRYLKSLPKMEAWAKREITVLFVFQAEREQVKKFVDKVQPMLREPVISAISEKPRYPFFFTDFATFANVPMGKALTERIYFWHDGKEWRLSNHD